MEVFVCQMIQSQVYSFTNMFLSDAPLQRTQSENPANVVRHAGVSLITAVQFSLIHLKLSDRSLRTAAFL